MNKIPTNDIDYIKELIFNKNYEDALDKVNSLLINFKNDHVLLTLKGVIYSQLNKFDDAIKYIDLARQYGCNRKEYNINIAGILSKKANFFYLNEDYDQALKYFIQSLDYSKDGLYLTYSNIGNSLSQLGRFDESVDYYLKSIKDNNNFAGSYSNLANLYIDKMEYSQAIEYAKKAYEIESDQPHYVRTYASCLFNLDRKEESLEIYKKLLMIDSRRGQTYFDVANVLFHLNEYKKTIKFLEDNINVTHQYSSINNFLGLSYYKLNQPELALDLLKKSLEIDPNDINVYQNITAIYEELGDEDNKNIYLNKYNKAKKNNDK